MKLSVFEVGVREQGRHMYHQCILIRVNQVFLSFPHALSVFSFFFSSSNSQFIPLSHVSGSNR